VLLVQNLAKVCHI